MTDDERIYPQRLSLLECPHCGKQMMDIFKKLKSGKIRILDSHCSCGYSLSAVKVPKGPLIERLTD